MKHPPYHLRPNKAVDRFMLVEAIRRLEKLGDLSEYTYYGLGGPYLEDFRLLYEFCPEIKMVSIEENEDTYKRQKFHRPCGTLRLRLVKSDFKSFVAGYDPKDEKSIFWLDYTSLEYGDIEDLMALIGKVAANSMIKTTFRAEPSDYLDKRWEKPGDGAKRFRQQFVAVMPDSSADPPRKFGEFARLLQDMVQIATQRTLPGALAHTFQPISSFYYSDGTGMFTLNGIVCSRDEVGDVRRAFQDWQFSNINWAQPKRIDVPVLSTKERLHLQEQLPCLSNSGRILRRALGYLIDDDRRKTETKLKQYADFHRYFPYFMKAMP